MDTALQGEEYYTLIGQKNSEGIKKYLHAQVQLFSPLSTVEGKDGVVNAVQNFMNSFKTLKVRNKFGSGDQAMIVYETDIPGISSHFPGASLLSFRDGQIVKIELFFDASQFK